MHYQEKLDNIFANGSLWEHRTFRTVFDPYSNEYNNTSMEQKVKYLRKCNEKGLTLDELILGYKAFYIEENKPYVINSLEDGLIRLMTYIMNEK